MSAMPIKELDTSKNANGFGNFEEVVQVSETLSEKLMDGFPIMELSVMWTMMGDLDLIISAYGQGTFLIAQESLSFQ